MTDWFRNVRSGQRGKLVQDDRGRDFIELDRNRQQIRVNYVPSQWLPDLDRKPLTKQQVAAITYEADRHLRRAIDHSDIGREWASMTPEQRLDWVDRGPSGGIRRRMFQAMCQVLGAEQK